MGGRHRLPCSLAHARHSLQLHRAPVTCARDSALCCSLRRRGSSPMAGCSSTTHPLPSARPHAVLPSSTPLMWLRHLRARTRARPLLCSLALDSVAFASPLCGHCQVNVPPPPLPPSLLAYPCMVFIMCDERQPEYAARYAFTGIQRHPPTVRAPPFGFSSFPSHHLMVGVVCS